RQRRRLHPPAVAATVFGSGGSGLLLGVRSASLLALALALRSGRGLLGALPGFGRGRLLLLGLVGGRRRIGPLGLLDLLPLLADPPALLDPVPLRFEPRDDRPGLHALTEAGKGHLARH